MLKGDLQQIIGRSLYRICTGKGLARERSAAFYENLIPLCVAGIPQSDEEKNADGCKV